MNFGKLFSFQGRVSRKMWWLTQLAMNIALVVAILASSVFFGPPDGSGDPTVPPAVAIILSLLFIPLFWIGLALSVKRWHDRDKSAWWILIALVPVIGGIWAFVENGFLRGTDGPNRYGADPLQD